MEDTKSLLARLEEKALFHTREADRYKTAAEVVRAVMYDNAPKAQLDSPAMVDPATQPEFALGQPADQPAPRKGPKSTMAMIQQVLSESDSPLRLTVLTERMIQSGWETSSAAPSNTVRTAVGRMVEANRAVRTPEGLYSMPERHQDLDYLPER